MKKKLVSSIGFAMASPAGEKHKERGGGEGGIAFCCFFGFRVGVSLCHHYFRFPSPYFAIIIFRVPTPAALCPVRRPFIPFHIAFSHHLPLFAALSVRSILLLTMSAIISIIFAEMAKSAVAFFD